MCTEFFWKCAARTPNHHHTQSVSCFQSLWNDFSLLCSCCCSPKTRILDREFRSYYLYFMCEFLFVCVVHSVYVYLVENIVCENYRQRFFAHSTPTHLRSFFFPCMYPMHLKFVVWSTVGLAILLWPLECQSSANKLNCGHFVVKTFLDGFHFTGKNHKSTCTAPPNANPYKYSTVRLHLYVLRISCLFTF